jgi:hypothetical protein
MEALEFYTFPLLLLNTDHLVGVLFHIGHDIYFRAMRDLAGKHVKHLSWSGAR